MGDYRRRRVHAVSQEEEEDQCDLKSLRRKLLLQPLSSLIHNVVLQTKFKRRLCWNCTRQRKFWMNYTNLPQEFYLIQIPPQIIKITLKSLSFRVTLQLPPPLVVN